MKTDDGDDRRDLESRLLEALDKKTGASTLSSVVQLVSILAALGAMFVWWGSREGASSVLDNRVAGLEADVATLRARVDAMRDRSGDVTRDVAVIRADVEAIKLSVRRVETRLDSVDAKAERARRRSGSQ